ncbi:hypothetical protein [Roseovarius sp. D22-M7]|uniref:hypothetical protein n=1 Tax=Roseovarius sp. D22-M7 TaxID=3127116 RepID=UPI00300FEEBF
MRKIERKHRLPEYLREEDDKLEKLKELEGLKDTYSFLYNPVIIFAMLCVSWYMSYTGVVAAASFLDEPTAATKRLAVIVTLAAMGGQYALWHMAQRLIPLFVTRGAVGIGIGVIAFLMTCLGTSSTYTGFIGLSEQSAQQHHIINEGERYPPQIELIEARGAALEDMLFFVEPQAKAACVRYEQELNSGVITGSRGKGLVTGQFLRICEAKESIVENLKATIALNDERSAIVGGLVEQMDDVIYDVSRPMYERLRAFLDLTRSVDGVLKAIRLDDRTVAVEASFQALGNSVASLDDASSGLQLAQAQVIAGIVVEEREAASAMTSMIDHIKSRSTPDFERARLLDAQEVVIRYWAKNITNLALVIVIDGYPIVSMLLFWAAALRAREGNTNQDEEIDE